MPVDVEQLASAPATNPEYPHSSSTGGMAARRPASSSESPSTEKGQTGAVGGSRFLHISRTISDLAASSPVLKAFTQRASGPKAFQQLPPKGALPMTPHAIPLPT